MGWWFGRKSAPADARPFVPWYASPGLTGSAEEEGFARSYSAQFDEVYRKNPVGQRAVRLVAGMLGALTVDADPSTGSGQAAAALVKRDGLLETLTANLLLHGNAYVQLIADHRDAPAELVLLRPERVSVVSDERGWPVAYLYRAGGQATRYDRADPLGRQQMAHIKALHPRDDHYGMGCIEAACPAASVHNRASRWNKALLDNAARPSGALSYEPADGATLSAEQFKRLKKELASEFAGSGNAGRPLLLEGGLKWQAMSLTPADMDFVALKEGAARDIALAFGVPPVLVGLPGDATYANAREAGRALYRQTILPMAGRILDALAAMLSDWLGPVSLSVDTDQLSELADDRAKLWEAVGSAGFLSDTEKREMLGFAIVTMSEAQAYVRIETGEEEALLAGLIRTASGLCEAFLNQAIIARPFECDVPASGCWERLPPTPVRAIIGVSSLDANGAATPLGVESFTIDIDSSGDGWVRVAPASGGTRARVSGTVGVAEEENGVPEPIRQGVLRLVAHLFTARDGSDGEPPAAVTALWRPYRRMRIS